MHRFTAGLLALLIAPSAMQAQAVASRRAPPPHRGVVSVNPIAIIAGYLTGDVEVRASKSFTLGAGGSWNGQDDDNQYRALEFKARYYPGERALRGFSVAATMGVASSAAWFADSPGAETTPRRRRPTIGTELSYQWIRGASGRFVTVLGAGVKRVLGDDGDVNTNGVLVVPTVRLSIGAAF